MQNQRGIWCRGVLGGLLVAVLLAASGRPAARADGPAPVRNTLIYHVTDHFAKLNLLEKSSRILELKSRIKTVDVHDPEVLSVFMVENPTNPRQIRVSATAPGLTNVVVVDEFGESFKLEVLVSGDVRHLQTILQLTFPNTTIDVMKVKGTIVLSGFVDQPSQITSIIQVAEQFFPEPINNIQVGGVQQVTLKVKIMEVQRGRIRKMGFNFMDFNDNGHLISNPGNLVPIKTITVPIGAPAGVEFLPGNTSAMFGITSSSNLFMGFIEALKEESMLKVLADPIVTVKSGERASLLSGGEFPILVPQSLGTLSVQFKSFGVKLDALPIVLGNGRLSLQVVPEVSERDFSNSVELTGNVIPGLTTRRVHTAVEMEFGQTFVIAGLIFNRDTASTFKVPFLGDLPVLGALFRRVRYDQSETELLVMVTPELADPLTPDQVPDRGPGQFTTAPTARELYLDGSIEIPDYGPPDCLDCDIEETLMPPNGLIVPQPDPAPESAVDSLPPAPPADKINITPPPAAPPAAPPAPQPEASARHSSGPSFGKRSGRPGLIAPRFTKTPKRHSPARRISRKQMAAPPRGATPYRGPRSKLPANMGFSKVKQASQTARPTTEPSKIRRVGSVREERSATKGSQAPVRRKNSGIGGNRSSASQANRKRQIRRRHMRPGFPNRNVRTATTRKKASPRFGKNQRRRSPVFTPTPSKSRPPRPGLIAPQDDRETKSSSAAKPLQP